MFRWLLGPGAEQRQLDARAEVRRLELEVELQWDVLRLANPDLRRRQVPLQRDLTRAHLRQARAEAPRVAHGLVVMLAGTGIIALTFQLLGLNYFTWWVSSGAVISVFFLFLSVTANLDEQPGLIAQDPLGFVGAVFGACSQLTGAWSIALEPTAPDRDLDGGRAAEHRSFLRWKTFDSLLTLIFTIPLMAALAFWVIVVAPAQYWTNLICGAPARQALSSSRRFWVVVTSNEGAGGGTHTEIITAPRSEPLPAGARESALVAKPVTLTAALAAALLLVVRLLQ